MISYKDFQYYRSLITEAENTLSTLRIPYSSHKVTRFGTENLGRKYGECKCYVLTGTSEIILHEGLVQTHNDKMIITTLIHEMLHSVCPKDGHRGMWKHYAQIVTRNTEYNIETYATEEEMENFRPEAKRKSSVKYLVTCKKCNAQTKYMKKTNFITREGMGYQCTGCGHSSFICKDVNGNTLFETVEWGFNPTL